MREACIQRATSERIWKGHLGKTSRKVHVTISRHDDHLHHQMRGKKKSGHLFSSQMCVPDSVAGAAVEQQQLSLS
jgi:hypothetical protein